MGPRTAARFVFYLLKAPKQEVQGLVESIAKLRNNMRFCPLCYEPFETENQSKSYSEVQDKLCQICSDPRRDNSLLCIVEKEVDLEAIEKTDYNGLYFILGKQKELQEQRFQKFAERLKKNNVKEIILALNFTSSSQRTLLWLKRKIKNLGLANGLKISQLGCGLPQGAELEYADEQTLSSALKSRS